MTFLENFHDDFSSQRFLVVGGAGFIGSNLVKQLLNQGCDYVCVVDNLLSSERFNLPNDPKVCFIEVSITDDAILASLADEFDYVFHLATFHGNQSSIACPLADLENNLLTTLKLYERIKDFKKIKKVVYAASGCLLAAHTLDKPVPTEEDGFVPFELDSPYQISKVTGELYSVYYHRQHGLPIVRARFQNVYGPGEVLGAGRWRGTLSTVWRNVAPTFIYKSLKGDSLLIEGNGAASRDFICVDDIVHGLMLCATRGAPGEVYNLATGVETSIKELAILINNLTGNSSPLHFIPKRSWDHAGRRTGATQKAKQCLGFEASVSLHEGLLRTIGWTRQNLSFIETNIQKHAVHINTGQQATFKERIKS